MSNTGKYYVSKIIQIIPKTESFSHLYNIKFCIRIETTDECSFF